jgi:uncharacterized coiled-coil protein SlyX
MSEYKVVGRDGGLNVVEFPGGGREHLSDEDLAALGGGEARERIKERKAVASLSEKAEELSDTVKNQTDTIARLEATLAERDKMVSDLEAEVRDLRDRLNGNPASSSSTPTTVQADPPVTLADALGADLSSAKLDELRAVAAVLEIPGSHEMVKRDLHAAIEAERERRRDSESEG